MPMFLVHPVLILSCNNALEYKHGAKYQRIFYFGLRLDSVVIGFKIREYCRWIKDQRILSLG